MSPFPSTLPEAALRAAAWALVHFVWQGALAAFAVAVLLRVLRGGSARLRYLSAVTGLAVMAALPLVTAFHLTAPDGGGTAVAAVGAPAAKSVRPEPLPTEIPAAAVPTERLRDSFEPFLPWLVAAWLLGVALLTAVHVGGWKRVRRLRLETAPAAERWQAALGRLAERLGVGRPVELLESARVRVPVVLGWIRPAILVPASTFTGLSPQQLEAVLAHELAHVRRHDHLVNLFQLMVETLLFYHPGVWWVSRQVRAERENCCDDVAVGLCASPLEYARALADLEELRFASPALALGADGGSLLGRVRRLVARDEEKPADGWLAAVVAALVATLVAALGAALLFIASSSSAMPAAEDQEENGAAAVEENRADGAPAADGDSEPAGRWIPGEPASDDRWIPGDPAADVRWLPGEPASDDRWIPGEPGDGWSRTSDAFQVAWADPQEDEARRDDEDGRRRVRWWREHDGEWIEHAVEDLRRAVEGTPYESLTDDHLTDLARHGFDHDLFPILVDAGLDGASAEELESLARYGIDAEDFRDYVRAGFPGLSIDGVAELARYGVDGDDARDYADSGLGALSIEEMVSLARYGVDGDDVREFAESGLTELSVDEIVKLARHGIDGEDAGDFRKSGYTLSVDDLVDLSRHGVDGDEARAYRAAGLEPSVEDMVRLAKHGIDGDDFREFREAGYQNLSVQQMVDLARNGIDGDDAREFQEAGHQDLSVEQMIELARNGIDGDEVREFQEAGNGDLTVEQMIELARNGIDGDDLKALRDAGHELSIEEVIRLARRGRLDEMMDE